MKKVTGTGIKRPRHIPQRTCVGCHTVLTKGSLVRIVRLVDGVRVDPTGKLAGRGAYIHGRRTCWQKALKGSLANALKVTLSATDLESLQAYLQTLPPDEAQEHVSMD